MKDIRMEVRKARIKQGKTYTALFNRGSGSDCATRFKLDGTRVTIKNITTVHGYGGYDGYRIAIVEDTFSVFPHELSEWREE